MKATIKLENGKELNIKLSLEQQEQVKEACKREFMIDYDMYKSSYENLNFVRTTDSIMQNSRKLLCQVDKLDELAKWLEPNWVADWLNDEQTKNSLYYEECNDKFYYKDSWENRNIGAVYMSFKTAKKICDALNDGTLKDIAEILKK